MSSMNRVVKVKRAEIAEMMTCRICQNLYRDATTIPECLHTFCRKCIDNVLVDEESAKCPECNIDLGCNPLDKLRPDRSWQDIRAKIFPLTKKKKNTPEASPSVMPVRIKERSLSSLGVDTPRISPVTSIRKAVTDAGSSNGFKRADPIWLSLVASNDQEGGAQLAQIPVNYLRVMDRTMPVSSIQKYLAKKLDLVNEKEVEIKCAGKSVIPTLQLNCLVEMWLQSYVKTPRVSTSVGSSAEDFVMVLSYARKGPSP